MWSILIVSLAMALRVAAFFDPRPLDTDEARYLITAHHFRTGLGYSDWRGPETHIHPLHPILVSLLGRDPGSLEMRGRLVSLACSLLMLWPLSTLARRFSGARGASIFLLLAGVHPWLVRAAAPAQPESLYDLVTALAILFLCRSTMRAGSSVIWAIAGGLFGLAYLARPEGFLVGSLAGAVGGWTHSPEWKRRCAALGLFFGGLLAVSSPFLLFVKASTGSWMLTGKTKELFFVGQAFYESASGNPLVRDYLPLMERWRSIGEFIAANPWITCLRVLRNIPDIWVGLFALGLGPAGLVGVAFCVASCARIRDKRIPLLLFACPCLTLVLMLLTFKNQRVVASTLPFAFLIASWGLADLFDRPILGSARRRALAAVALVVCALAWWIPSLVRLASGERDGLAVRDVVREALQVSGSPERLACTRPELSFYAMDPMMYGPAGHYSPFPFADSCAEMTAELGRRGCTTLLLETTPLTPALHFDEAGCALRLVSRWDSRREGRAIVLAALKR